LDIFKRGLFALVLMIFFQTCLSAEYLYKDELIHNPKFQKDINNLGKEVYDKTGISLRLIMLKQLPKDTKIQDYEKEVLKNFTKPTIVLVFSELDKDVDIWVTDTYLYKYFNKKQVLSPVASPVQAFFMSILFARSVDDVKDLMSGAEGSILPLLGNQVKGSQLGKYSAAMYNGYLDVAMQVAESKNVSLDNGISSSNKYPLTIVKILFYGFLLYSLFLYIRGKFRKKRVENE